MLKRFQRSLKPQRAVPIRIAKYKTLTLEISGRSGRALLDGKKYKANIGCWMFYLPKLHAKFFHAQKGMIDCTRTPDLDEIHDPEQLIGRYTAAEWLDTLQTPVTYRLAEIWLVSARLWRAGLGPQPVGICFVNKLIRDSVELGQTCGLLIQNVHNLPRKRDCELAQIIAAGVIPDKILSCVRQQLRGYVIDLCAVKGCLPADAEYEVEKLVQLFQADMSDADLVPILEQALSW